MDQKIELSLEYYELEKIYHYLKIASRKHDTTVPKFRTALDFMNNINHPICKIVVEYIS
jgi:hypothetical protein